MRESPLKGKTYIKKKGQQIALPSKEGQGDSVISNQKKEGGRGEREQTLTNERTRELDEIKKKKEWQHAARGRGGDR